MIKTFLSPFLRLLPMLLRLRSLALIAALAVPAGFAALPAQAQDAGEIMIRLDRLEAANRQLTGQVEEARNQVKRLEEQLRRMQADVDFRFQDLQGGKGGAKPAAGSNKRSDAFDPGAQPQAPGAPQQLGATGTLPPAAERHSERTVGDIINEEPGMRQRGPGEPLPLGRAAPGAANVPQMASLPAGGTSQQDELSLAKGFLQRGDYELAEGQYREFMRTYPRDRLVPEAQFGLAETFFLRQRYQEAAEQYLNLSTQHPQSALAPEGLLKLAMSLRAIGENKQACGTLGEINRKYPKSSAALKTAVEREQKRSRC
jgi:tol-pal system protein YbgF